MFIDKKFKFMKNFNIKFHEIYPNDFFTNEKNDAKKFINIVKKKYKNYKFNVLKDDYRLNYIWEKHVSKKINSKMIVIDDFKNLDHCADIIINPKTKFYKIENPVKKIISNKKITYLLGPKFSFINKKVKNNRNSKFTVVFNFGASKNTKLINNILSYILLKCKSINFIFVLGPYYKIDYLKKKFNRKFYNISFVNNEYNLQKIYSTSHLFVGAAGNSVYETTAQNLPAIFFEISDNQKTSIVSLQKMGQFFYLNKSDLNKKGIPKIIELIKIIKKNYSIVSKAIKTASLKIDDKGVNRIVRLITSEYKLQNNNTIVSDKGFKESKYKIIKCNFNDINNYLEARNRSENIKQSFRYKPIKKIDHYFWWFNNKVTSFKLNKEDETKLYFYHFIIKLFSKKYYISGWFNASNNTSIQDIIYALDWQRKYINFKSNKISSWISFVKKDNLLALKYSSKLGWIKLSNKNKLYNILKSKYKFNDTYVYIRK